MESNFFLISTPTPQTRDKEKFKNLPSLLFQDKNKSFLKLTYNFIILKNKRNESKKDENVAGNGVWNYKLMIQCEWVFRIWNVGE